MKKRDLTRDEKARTESAIKRYEEQIEEGLFKRKSLEFETSKPVLDHKQYVLDTTNLLQKKKLNQLNNEIAQVENMINIMKDQIKNGVEIKEADK